MKSNPCLMPIAAMLFISLLSSCTTNLELPPPPPVYSSSSAVEQSSSSSIAEISSSSTGEVLSSSSAISSSSLASSSSTPSSSSSSSSVLVVSNCSLNGGAVNIGGQVWMAKNLNCDVSGSKCYGNNATNCDVYGRLYDWATAMALPSTCSSTSCSSQIGAKHQGICPSGWHIPTQAEWDAFASYVQSDKDCTSCDAKHLKAASGWNNSGNGLDSYGFSALPGGYGGSVGSFSNVGDYGYWWGASEDSSLGAYYRAMDYDGEDAYWSRSGKSYLFSVRCLQD